MNIIAHIEYLLTRHDCVIVPGIGAILAHNVPAYFDDVRWLWSPPTRIFSFNPELNRTDGLLAASVARRSNISMDAAATLVRDECDNLRQILVKDRFLSLGDAGALSMSADGKLAFIPGETAWLSPALMWLPEVSASEVAANEFTRGGHSSAIRDFGIVARRRKRFEQMRRTASVAASILVVFALGWIIWGNISNINTINFASIFPVSDNSEAHDPDFFDEVISSEPPLVVLSQEPVGQSQPEDAETIENTAASDAKYLLIVASLSSEKEAYRFVSQYPDLPLAVSCQDGRFRVYAAAGDSWDAVAAAADSPEIYDNFPSSWVFVR